MANIDDILRRESERTGVPIRTLRAFAKIESGGNPRVRTGSYKGLFQLSDSEFRKYGGRGDIYDPAENARAAANKLAAESATFQKKYGRAPTAADLYMIHQQGEGGAANHWANPDKPAWMNMYATGEGRKKGANWARQAIWGNVPTDMRRKFGSVDNITSRQFLDMWGQKVERFGGDRSPLVTPVSSGEGIGYEPAKANFEYREQTGMGSEPTIHGNLNESSPYAPAPPSNINQPTDTPVQGTSVTQEPIQTSQEPIQTSTDVFAMDTDTTFNTMPGEKFEPTERTPMENMGVPLAPQANDTLGLYQPGQTRVESEPQILDVAPPVTDGTEDFSEDLKTGVYSRDNALRDIAENKGWFDRLDAAAETNMTGDMVQQLWRGVSGIFVDEDPDFQLQADQLAAYEGPFQEFLADSKNAIDFASRKADVDQRIEAYQALDGHYGWKAANFVADVVPAIVLSAFVDKGFSTLALASRLDMANKLTRMSVFGTSGASYGAMEYYLNKEAGNDPNFMLTVGGSILGGMAYGAFARASKETKIRAAEAADDAIVREAHPEKVAREAAEKGLPEEAFAKRDGTKPRNQVVEEEVVGGPIRPAIDEDRAVKVHRTAQGERLKAAMDNFEEDILSFQKLSQSLKLGARMSKNAMTEMKNIFNRQAHRMQNTETYYVYLPKGRTADLEEALKAGVVKLHKTIDEIVPVAQAYKTGGKGNPGKAMVAAVQVPKGSRVMRSDDLGHTFPGELVLGEGSVHLNPKKTVTVQKLQREGVEVMSKDGRPVEVSVVPMTHAPTKAAGRETGKEVVMQATLKEGGKGVHPDELYKMADDSYTIKGSGVGADITKDMPNVRRETPVLKTITKEAEEIAMAPYKDGGRPEANSWWSKFWGGWATEAGQGLTSSNKLEAHLSSQLMYQGMDPTAKNLNKGGKEVPQALDEASMAIIEAKDARVIKMWSKIYDEFVDDFMKHEEKLFDDTDQIIPLNMTQKAINKLPKAAQKAHAKKLSVEFHQRFSDMVWEMMNHPEKLEKIQENIPSLKKAVDLIDREYAKYLDELAEADVAHMADVKKALLESKRKYKPRLWSHTKIQIMISQHGTNVYRDWLVGSMEKAMSKNTVVKVNGEDVVLKTPHLSRKQITKIADMFHDTVLRSKGGYQMVHDVLTGNMDVEAFVQIAKQNGHVIDDDLQSLMKLWTRPEIEQQGTAGARTYRRGMIDESYVMRGYNNKPGDISLKDFVNTDVIGAYRNYNRAMGGRLAMARTRLTDADGRPLTKHDGYIKTDRDIERVMEHVHDWGQQHGLPEGEIKGSMKRLQTYFDYIRGYAKEEDWIGRKGEQRVRWLLMATTLSKMGRSGLNQVVETGNLVGEHGFDVIGNLHHIKRGFRNVDDMAAKMDEKGLKDLLDLLEYEVGAATHTARSKTHGKGSGTHIFGNDFVDETGSTLGIKNKNLIAPVRAVVVGAGMIPMTAGSQAMGYAMKASQLTRAAVKTGGDFSKASRSMKRMVYSMGFDDVRAQKLFEMMSNPKVFKTEPGWAKAKLTHVDTSHPAFDAKLASEWALGLRRLVTRSIQDNKYGTMHRAYDTNVGRLIGQFKSFTYSSVTQQFTQKVRQFSAGALDAKDAVKNADMAMFGDAMLDMAKPVTSVAAQGGLAILAYYIQLNLATIGMSSSDRKKYMKKHFTYKNMALASLSKSGMLGWVPTIWDMTGGSMTGKMLSSGFRTSGLENVLIPPSFQMLNADSKALWKLAQGMTGFHEYDAKDAKNFRQIFTNFWAAELVYNGIANAMLKQPR